VGDEGEIVKVWIPSTQLAGEREKGDGEKEKGDSPPVAKGGLLTNPAINLKTQKPAKFSTKAVGICNKQNMASGMM
jgi:hypothetical protein